MAKKGEAKTKKTILMLTPATHLRLKVLAAATGLTMGDFLTKVLNRFEPGQNYTVDDDLQFLEHLEMFAKSEQAKAKTKVDKLEIREAG